ncbi:hypothetical protein SGRIM128S_07931 [Streptomyces griseomycini]
MTDGAAAATDTRPTKIVYVAEATAHGGRDGYVTSHDGHIGLRVAMPPELGGDGDGTNPEQLFAAGFSACFHNALSGRTAPRSRRAAGPRACAGRPPGTPAPRAIPLRCAS